MPLSLPNRLGSLWKAPTYPGHPLLFINALWNPIPPSHTSICNKSIKILLKHKMQASGVPLYFYNFLSNSVQRVTMASFFASMGPFPAFVLQKLGPFLGYYIAFGPFQYVSIPRTYHVNPSVCLCVDHNQDPDIWKLSETTWDIPGTTEDILWITGTYLEQHWT